MTFGSTRFWQWLLAAAGASALTWCAIVEVQGHLYQRKAEAAFDRVLPSESPSAAKPLQPEPAQPKYVGIVDGKPVVGRLEIPRANLSVMVVEGDDDASLRVSAGHLSDTPLPWEDGNSAIAGHRDTFFRGLRSIKLQDELRVTTSHGSQTYRVSRITIVDPSDLSVLLPTPERSLTLITCYPFSYIGHAPRRFIVQASEVPDASAHLQTISTTR